MKINEFFWNKFKRFRYCFILRIFIFTIPINKKYHILLQNGLNIPWNVLILFGGGLAMASLVIVTGLANEISIYSFLNKRYNFNYIIFNISNIFFYRIYEQYCDHFLLLPLLKTFAIDSGLDIVKIILPVVFSISCAFMMPISTPPNAIVFN